MKDYAKIHELVGQAKESIKQLNDNHKALEDLDVMVDIQVRMGRITCIYTIELESTKPQFELQVDWASVMSAGEPEHTKLDSYDGCEEKNDDDDD